MKLRQAELVKSGTVSTSIQLKKGRIKANILQRCFGFHIYYATEATQT